MKAIVGNEIRVIEPTSDFRKKVESDLTVSNPEFARLKKWESGQVEHLAQSDSTEQKGRI